MNIVNLLRRFRHSGLLAILALGTFVSSSRAVDYNTWVYARGQWALLVSGSNTGGRVQYSPAYGCAITDRAARGETVCITPWATYPGEYVIGSYRSYTCGTTQMGTVPLPGSQQFAVSTNPNCDNLHYTICTQYRPNGLTRRIPIGGRP